MSIHARRLLVAGLTALTVAATATAPLTDADASPTARAAACTGAQLSVHLGKPDGTAGTTYQRVRFRNVSSTPCTLDGYPGFRYVNADGDAIGYPAKPEGPHHAVTVAPDAVAVAALGIPDYLNFPRARCHPRRTAQLSVKAPGTTQRHLVRFKATVCTTRAGRSLSLAVRHRF